MQYEDQLEQELLRKGNADFSAFLSDISAVPRPADVVRKSRKEQEAETLEDNWRQFCERCDFQAANGTAVGHARLRSERDESGEPLEKILGELPGRMNSTLFRPGRAELPLEKQAGDGEANLRKQSTPGGGSGVNDRGHRLLDILKRSATAVDEEMEEVLDDFKDLISIQAPTVSIELQK